MATFGDVALKHVTADLTNGVVKIRRAVVRVDGEFIIGTPKSDAGSRDVSIPPHLLPDAKSSADDGGETYAPVGSRGAPQDS